LASPNRGIRTDPPIRQRREQRLDLDPSLATESDPSILETPVSQQLAEAFTLTHQDNPDKCPLMLKNLMREHQRDTSQHLTWRGLHKTVHDVCTKCDTCQRTKRTKNKYGKLPPKEAETIPWDTLYVNLIIILQFVGVTAVERTT
jgi:Integrase zinc binding domain